MKNGLQHTVQRSLLKNLFCIGLWFMVNHGQTAVLEIDEAFTTRSLAPYIYHFDDLPEQSPGEIDYRLFSPLNQDYVLLGFKRSRQWFYFDVINRQPRNQKLVFHIDYALNDRVDIFVLDADRNIVAQYEQGDERPFGNRSYFYPDMSQILTLPHGQPMRIVFTVQSENSLVFPVRLSTPDDYANRLAFAAGVSGIVYGGIIALLIVNLILYFRTREQTYAYFSGYVFFVSGCLAGMDGWFLYLFPGFPEFNEYWHPVSGVVGMIFGMVFAMRFLQPRRQMLLRYSALSLFAFGASCIAVFLLYSRFVGLIMITAMALLVGTYLLVIALLALHNRRIETLYYVGSWAIFFVALTIYSARVLGYDLVGESFSTLMLFKSTLALQFLVLSLGIGEKVVELGRQEAVYQNQLRLVDEVGRKQRQFFSRISHEIRTPMNGIMGLSQLLTDSRLSEQQRRLVDAIYQSAEGLVDVVSEIVEYARLEGRQVTLQPEPTHLDVIAKELSALAEVHTVDVKLWLDDALPADVVIDGHRLRQVLLNILNWLGQQRRQCQAQVAMVIEDLAPAGETGRIVTVAFSVVSTGVVIPEAEQADLLTPYGSGRLEIAPGSAGFGLAIAAQLVEIMGGKLTIESNSATGTRFLFSLAMPVAG